MRTQARPFETATVRLKQAAFDQYCRALELDDVYARANFIGVHRWTIRRIEDGGPMSERFIAQTIAAFGLKFEDLFEVKVTKAAPVPEPVRRSA